MKFIDAHSHWSDDRLFLHPERDQLIQKAKTEGVVYTLLGGVDPDDWSRQLQLKKMDPSFFGLCFGLHPYRIKDLSAEECENRLDQLAKVISQCQAVGETGLDKRDQYWLGFENLQIEMFENHIQLAKAIGKPLVLHIVRAHEEALKVMDMWSDGQCRGFVHAFNGSYETAKRYIDHGLKLSVGGALTYSKNHKLRQAVQKISLEHWLIESDAPDQPPQGWPSPVNDSTSVKLIAQAIAEIKAVDVAKVAEQTQINFNSLF